MPPHSKAFGLVFEAVSPKLGKTRMRLLWHSSISWLLCFAPGDATGTAPSEIQVTHQARSLQPGEVVLLKAQSREPLRRLTASAFGRSFPLFTDAKGLAWTGLIGIDLETKPGRHTVRLRGTDANGGTVLAEDTFTVTAKTFPTRRLTVDEKFVNPPQQALARIREESARMRAIFDTVTPRRYWSGSFSLPVPGPVISAFGKRSVYNGQPRSPHAGTDFQGASGTPIHAPNAGKVVLASALYYSGNTVILDHGLGLYSYFGHMSSFSVKEGDQVNSGEVVGKVGATGVVTGPHLHWSVRLAGTRVDPMSLIHVLTDK
jgi:murein DD-endopeptidase MepM/ murein hydrolase activator NlpD